ncbi:TIGR03087 family PEP-CTERM/XrtA system glycosyltransferase [Rubrivivax albus]|uniref:TIGR03087 family PEP-CTERM/XrtA system glycosyltransferase n=1 Tax=Rubrivivax albus TaxID=2499835 RepID=A0A3S2TP83_9BURK|nr:TIGR03087 family PEP-CTERM/XrtA system glycosyltransferase [Rubrivivax albus]RVT53445.1 TIGR03087 family PEP-CTERM/XrtA system glycosyltransferase [Rubrivivax albus]
MARILYLVHRLPYPPNKGDKVRSYHLLRHLAERHDVLLGTFVDDPDDEPHVATVRQWCADVKAVRLHPRRARLASLQGLLRGEPLTLAYYRNAELMAWARAQQADAAVVFSSSMAPYAEGFGGPVLVDFVDVDSAKWADYAGNHRWPLSWLYRREGRELLAYERAVAVKATQSFFVTDKEVALFTGLAPECAGRVQAVGNGVDTTYFAPDPARPNPYDPGEVPVVFTGAMDYWPNVDAVTWFAAEMLPALRARWPGLRLSIVGRSPTAAVQALAGDAVRVTGTVPDVRPWLQHAAVVVAPLRLARGVQNKVLEAMAMARPVVAAATCVEAIEAVPGHDLAAASDPADYIAQVDAWLSRPEEREHIGRQARACVVSRYGWSPRLAPVDRCLEPA